MNVKVTISYDGFEFSGSQRQPEKTSVEDGLLEAFERLNVKAKIILSGRTDKGVHATGQVFSVKIPEHFKDLERFKELLNHQLPLSIRALKVEKVDDNFHARFSAKKRIYRYFITQNPTTPFNARYITHVEPINETLIKEAIKIFLGEHNFEYFQKIGSDKINFNKVVYEARFYAYKDMYVFKFKANSYLRSQIRLMVGFLLKISQGKLTIEDLQAQLNRERKPFYTPVDGFGLYLAKIIY